MKSDQWISLTIEEWGRVTGQKDWTHSREAGTKGQGLQWAWSLFQCSCLGQVGDREGVRVP